MVIVKFSLVALREVLPPLRRSVGGMGQSTLLSAVWVEGGC